MNQIPVYGPDKCQRRMDKKVKPEICLSSSYECAWDEEEARKQILRTHTTAISSRMLSRVAHEMQASVRP